MYKDKDTLNSSQESNLLDLVNRGIILPQYSKDGSIHLNPHGTVSRGEVLGLLNSNGVEQDSLDNVSKGSDFYNRGYNALVTDGDANFYNVYTGSDLVKPVRLSELAYMIAHFHDYADDVLIEYSLTSTLDKVYSGNDSSMSLKLELPVDDTLSFLLPSEGYSSIDNYYEQVESGVASIRTELLLLSFTLTNQVPYDKVVSPLNMVSRLEFATIVKEFSL